MLTKLEEQVLRETREVVGSQIQLSDASIMYIRRPVCRAAMQSVPYLVF